MKKLFLPVFLLSLFVCGCAIFTPVPDLSIKPQFDRKDVAVLDFAAKGMHLSNSLGVFTADCLTSGLYLINKVSVIDRAKVRDAEQLLGISSSNILSLDEIQRLGLRLKAKYLILGNIYQYDSGEAFTSAAEPMLSISFRIISIPSTDVVGMVSHKLSMKDCSAEEVIQKMVLEILQKMQEPDK